MHPLDLASFPIRFAAGFLSAALLWFAAVVIGVRVARLVVRGPLAVLAFGAAAGYAIIGSLVAVLGVVHLAKAPLVIAMVCVLAIAGLVWSAPLLVRRRELADAMAAWLASTDALDRGLLAVSAFALLTALISAALPAVWWDPIAYHLPIALHALASGGFDVDLGMIQTSYPALAEAAALPAYAIAGSAGAAMSTLFAGVVLALICAAIAEKVAPGSALLSAMLVLTSALWLWLAPSFYVDVPFALFAVAAIGTPVLAASAADRVAIGCLAGGLAGASAGIKYPGIVVALLAAVLIVWLVARPRALAFAGFAVAFVVIAAGWYVRNYIATGDPVYPYLTATVWSGMPASAISATLTGWSSQWCGGGSSAADLFTLPWRLLTEPRAFCGDPGYALRVGIVLALAALVMVRRSWPIALACAGLTAFWFASSQQLRFLTPAVALFAVLAAVGASALPRMRAVATVILLVLGFAGVFVNWLPQTLGESSSSVVPGYAYVLGRESAPSYLQRRLETYGSAQWLQAQHVARDQVISLDDIRTYYFWGGIAWANPYYERVWNLDWTKSAAERYAPLLRHGYRFLLVNDSAAFVHRTPTGVDWNVLAADIAGGALHKVYQDGDVAVYAIAPGAARM